MLHCISGKSSASSPFSSSPAANNNVNSHPAHSQANSSDGTPRASAVPSPTVNLTREYIQAVQTNSYNEMWSKIHVVDPGGGGESGQDHVLSEDQEQLLLEQVLQPNRQCVEEALSCARHNSLTRLVSSYFDHSENTSHLCLLLHQSVHGARDLYAPLYRLLDVLPLDGQSFSQSQCDRAFDVFLEFDSRDNPFPCPESHNFSEMRSCFSQLKQQLDHRLCKSRSRIRLVRNAAIGSAACFIGTSVGATLFAIFGHALLALVAAPFFTTCPTPKFSKKEHAHVVQLEAAAKGTFVLNNDLDTIDRLVDRLYTAVECDKLLIRLGLERGRDRHPIQEVMKQLRKNHVNFLDQLRDLEEHICLCFATVNRARSLLLQEINIHQTSNS